MSVLWTLGLYSLFGFTYNVLASMVVPLIVVLAIADDVHIMQHWDEEASADVAYTISRTPSPRRHRLEASVTTALACSGHERGGRGSIVRIGSAVGIMVDFAISLVLMPTMLSLVKPETAETPHERYLLPPLMRAARWSTRHPGRVFACGGGAADVGGHRLRVDTNHINFFSRTHLLGRSAAVIDPKLAGVYSYQIMLEGARLVPAARDPGEDRAASKRVAARAARPQGDLRRRLREADPPRAERRTPRRERDPGRPGDGGAGAVRVHDRRKGGTSWNESSPATSPARRSPIKLQSMSSDLVLEQVEHADVRAKELFAGSGISVLTTGPDACSAHWTTTW